MVTDSDSQSDDQTRAVVDIWTDGGCKPNPGPGGWGVLLRCKGVERELSGGEEATTYNRMELRASAEALEALTSACTVSFDTDRHYSRYGCTH